MKGRKARAIPWLLLAVIPLVAGIAYASTNRIAPHMIVREVKFRTHTITNQLGFHLDLGGIGCVDSVSFQKVGAATADTTVEINLIGLSSPEQQSGAAPTTTATDSTSMIGRLFLIPGANNGAVDSLYVTTQYSPDGVNWIQQDSEVNTQGNILTNGQTGAGTASPFFSLIVRSSAITNGLDIHLSRTTRMMPYIRFIVRDKVASTTVIHNFTAKFVTLGTGEEFGQQ